MRDRETLALQVINLIAEHNGDLNAAFPNPFRFHNQRRGRKQAFFDRELAHLLTERDPVHPWGWEANGAYFVRPNQNAISAFVDGRLDIVPHRWRAGHGKPKSKETSQAEEAAGHDKG